MARFARIPRRSFLGALGGAAAALPFLRSFEVSADAPAQTKLLIIGGPNGQLVGPNGGNPGGGYAGWRPAGLAGTDSPLPASLPDVLSPLDAHVDRLLFLEGVAGLPTQGGHTQSASLLTGRLLRPTPGGDDNDFVGSGISIDEHLANELDTRVLRTAFKIEGFAPGESRWMFDADGNPLYPDQNPVDAYERVFGEGLDTSAAQALLARRTSVLDVAARDLQALRSRVPSADRARLDAHLEAVFELEQDLVETASLQCATPAVPADYPALDDESFPRVVADHTEIVVQALSCGWGRIATLQLGNFGGGYVPNWPDLGIETTYKCHSIAHAFQGIDGAGSEGLSQATAVGLGLQLERIFSRVVADVLDRLAEVPDIDGRPMLDNTLVLVVRPHGINHDDNHLLWMVAGGDGVNVRGGRFLQVGDGESNKRLFNDVLVGVGRSMGVAMDAFGAAEYNDAPVSFA